MRKTEYYQNCGKSDEISLNFRTVSILQIRAQILNQAAQAWLKNRISWKEDKERSPLSAEK
jgi:hypothetical protein